MVSLKINDDFDLFEMLAEELRHTGISTSNIFGVTSDDDFTYHTLDPDEMEDGLPEICFAINFREHVIHHKDPDVFFSGAENLRCGRMGLFVFASKDESLTGRCNMVQHSNDSIFVTVINSEVTALDLFSILSDGGEGDIFQLDTHVREMKALKKKSSTYYRRHIQVSIDNFVLIVAKRIEAQVQRIPELEPWDDEDLFETAQIPNIEKVLAGSQDPLHRMENGVVTIRDGTIAFEPSFDATVPRTTRVAFEIRDLHSFYSTEVNSVIVSLGSVVSITTIGIPMAHICYVLDVAIDLALKIRSFDCEAYHQLQDLLQNVCDKKTIAAIEKKVEAKKKAIATVARILKQNLHQIKAKLWRPDGVLVRKMIEADIKETSDDICK